MTQVTVASDRAAVVAVIDPDAYGAGGVTSDWVDASKFHRFMAIVTAGVFVATGLLDFKLQQATDGSGTGAKDITGKSITQLTAAGSDDDKQAIINASMDELDTNNAFTHIAMVMTLTTAGADSGAIMLAFDARQEPGSNDDLASVAEIIF